MNDIGNSAVHQAPLPNVEGSFPFWDTYLTEPNREESSASLLQDRLGLTVYWPHYEVQIFRRGKEGIRRVKAKSVIPGVLLAPQGIFAGCRYDAIGWARIRPVSFGRTITEAEVEVIRQIEGRLRIREIAKVAGFEVGQRVRFINGIFAAFLGDGIVTAVAKGGRISVKIDGKLFGGQDLITVRADELEPM